MQNVAPILSTPFCQFQLLDIKPIGIHDLYPGSDKVRDESLGVVVLGFHYWILLIGGF
jgi:hypothetical protein